VFKVVNKLAAELLKVHPIAVFLLMLLITVFGAAFLPHIKFNYNIERFFSSEDGEVLLYEEHKEIFENENNALLIGLKNHEGIFQHDFLSRVDSLSDNLKKVRWIKRVISPTNLKETIKTTLGPIQIPIIHLNDPDKIPSDKKRIYRSKIYTQSFFSQDTSAVSLLIKLDSGLTKAASDSLLTHVKNEVATLQFDDFHLAGRIHTQAYYIKQMQKQMGLFAGLASLLLIASLYLIFRNFFYVLIAAVSVLVALVWIFGIIAWQEIQIDLMLTMLPALVFIISISGIIHIISRFKNELLQAATKKAAIQKAFEHTVIPNFLNAFTTAIGFSSLVFIPIQPIQQFGLLVAAGIILSFLVNLLVVPFALMILPSSPNKTVKSEIIHVPTFFEKSLKTSKPVFLVLTLLIITSLYFTSTVETKNHFLDDLNPNSTLKKDLDFFDKNFSGIRPFELNIQSKNGQNLLSLPVLLQLDTLERYLATEYKVGFMLSPLTIIKTINKSLKGGNQAYYKLPSTQDELDQIVSLANKRRLWNRFTPLVNGDFTMARLSGRTADEGSLIFRKRNQELNHFLSNHASLLHASITGAAHLMDNANQNIAMNLLSGILLAVLIATLIIGLFTGSLNLAMLSLIPNLLPLLLISGFMGFTGIPLKVSSALVFTIVYGIAVDDTIHFLNSYHINKKTYNNRQDAIAATITAMWKPMMYTSIVLASGFMIFTLSEFPSISLLGYLVSASMVVALFADLVILPLLLKSRNKFKSLSGLQQKTY